ncbi:augmin subunit 5 [Tanacetum coccineum]
MTGVAPPSSPAWHRHHHRRHALTIAVTTVSVRARGRVGAVELVQGVFYPRMKVEHILASSNVKAGDGPSEAEFYIAPSTVADQNVTFVVGGTILAAKLAKERGCAINVDGCIDKKSSSGLRGCPWHWNGRGEGQWHLKGNVKGTEALERKKRDAEKGQIMVGFRARKEAKQKHKPGLTEGSDDSYVKRVLVRARINGWRKVALNSRGCAYLSLWYSSVFLIFRITALYMIPWPREIQSRKQPASNARTMVLAYDLMVIAESMDVVDNLANALLLYQLKWKKIEEFGARRLELKSICCALLRANMGAAAFWSQRPVAAGDYASSTRRISSCSGKTQSKRSEELAMSVHGSILLTQLVRHAHNLPPVMYKNDIVNAKLEEVNGYLEILRPVTTNFGGRAEVLSVQEGEYIVKYIGPE